MAEQTTSRGISTSGLLGVLFVGLKLGGVIDWPWVWVLAPFWAPVAILLALIILMLLVYFFLQLLPKNNA